MRIWVDVSLKSQVSCVRQQYFNNSSKLIQDYEYEYEEDPNAIEGLPASAADLLDKPYDDGFNCDQQDHGYGYYADPLNDCKVTFQIHKNICSSLVSDTKNIWNISTVSKYFSAEPWFRDNSSSLKKHQLFTSFEPTKYLSFVEFLCLLNNHDLWILK